MSGERKLRLEPFIEIFRSNVYLTSLTREEDQSVVFDQLLKRMKAPGFEFTPEMTERLLYLTSGHVGLIRACFGILDSLIKAPSREAAMLLALKRAVVVRECDILLSSLSQNEHTLLDLISTGSVIDEDNVARQMVLRGLKAKKVIEPFKQSYRVTPPLLQIYLAGKRAGLYQSDDV